MSKQSESVETGSTPTTVVPPVEVQTTMTTAQPTEETSQATTPSSIFTPDPESHARRQKQLDQAFANSAVYWCPQPVQVNINDYFELCGLSQQPKSGTGGVSTSSQGNSTAPPSPSPSAPSPSSSSNAAVAQREQELLQHYIAMVQQADQDTQEEGLQGMLEQAEKDCPALKSLLTEEDKESWN